MASDLDISQNHSLTDSAANSEQNGITSGEFQDNSQEETNILNTAAHFQQDSNDSSGDQQTIDSIGEQQGYILNIESQDYKITGLEQDNKTDEQHRKDNVTNEQHRKDNETDEHHHNNNGDDVKLKDEKDQVQENPAPVTPPTNHSAEIISSATRRVSTRKRRMAAPATVSSNSVKRRRASNNRRSITPVSSTPRSAKRGRKRVEEYQGPPLIDLDDPDDPYNFTANSDVHPSPLKDISIKRTSFGELKFTKSMPSSSERYANVERIAAERNPAGSKNLATPSHSISKSTDSFRLELSLSNLSSPKSAALNSTSRVGGTISRMKSETFQDSNDNYKMEEDEELLTPKRRGRKTVASPKTPKNTANFTLEANNKSLILNTPETGKRKPQTVVSASSRKAVEEADLYIVPKLTPAEQYVVDHPGDISHFLSPGARVLALWGNEYYGAHICGREALGRYYVLFAEDNLKRVVPPSGVLAISFLNEGDEVSFIDVIDGEEIGKVARLEKKPEPVDKDQPDEWIIGRFSLRELDDVFNSTDAVKEVLWSRIYLSKEQAAVILKGKQFNPVPKIDQENIVSESRSTRRSRSGRLYDYCSDFGSPSPMKNSVFGETPIKSPMKSPRGKVNSTPRGNQTKIHLDNISEEKIVSEDDVQKTEDNTSETLDNTSPKTRSRRSETNVTSPQKQQSVSPRKSPRTANKMNESDDVDLKDFMKISDYEDDFESPIPPKRKPSPFDNLQILTPVQEITEYCSQTSINLNTSCSTTSSAGSIDESKLFMGYKFVLTSANRANRVSDFNKREYRTKIEERGGVVMEDFSNLNEDDKAFLIADTFYRTHKYLCALALSIPCVSYLWIQECLSKKELINHENFMLPAGESTSEPDRICPWKPLKGILFKGKRVIIYTRFLHDDPNVIPFNEIWVSLMQNLGATVVGIEPGEPFSKEANNTATLDSKLEFCRKTNFDILLTENDCERVLAGCASAKNALAVSSEWVIQAMVTGELPPVEASDRFRYDFA